MKPDRFASFASSVVKELDRVPCGDPSEAIGPHSISTRFENVYGFFRFFMISEKPIRFFAEGALRRRPEAEEGAVDDLVGAGRGDAEGLSDLAEGRRYLLVCLVLDARKRHPGDSHSIPKMNDKVNKNLTKSCQ